MPEVFATDHAIQRYKERFERTSNEAARWAIQALVDEARGLTLSELLLLKRMNLWRPTSVYLLHEFTGLLAVLRIENLSAVVVTLYAPKCFQRTDSQSLQRTA